MIILTSVRGPTPSMRFRPPYKRSAGYDEESGHFAPGSQPRSLFNSGQ
jgi:hypothetical protein